MTNPLDYCLKAVARKIPPQILELALRHYNYTHNEHLTLTAFIVKEIIDGAILVDANLTSGRVKTIPLRTTWIENVPRDHAGYAGDDGEFTLFRIPPEFRDNMPITMVLALQYPFNTYIGGGTGDLAVGTGGYNLNDQINEILNSYTLASPRNHPVAELLDGDLIRITPTQYAHQNWLLTCRIAYDDQFTSLDISSIPVLANLAVMATKQWCYTNLRIPADRAVQETGMDLPTITSILDEWRDIDQLYQEEFIKFRGTSNISPDLYRQLVLFMV